MKVFPSRPVTAKPGETRMGKGKGYVDYYATWVSPGKVLFEVDGVRRELAVKALKIAAQFLPIRCKIVEKQDFKSLNSFPCLPSFIRERLKHREKEMLIEKGRK